MTNVPSQSVPTDLIFPDFTATQQELHQVTLSDNKCACRSQEEIEPFNFCLPMTEAQPLTTTNLRTPINIERSCIEFGGNNCHSYDGRRANDMAKYSNESQKVRNTELNDVQEILNYVPPLPSRYRQRVNGNNVNFVLIATSLDQPDIFRELNKTLESETSMAIPLSFKKESTREMSKDLSKNPETVSVSQSKDKKNEESLELDKAISTANLKRKHDQDTDFEYWER